MNAKPPMRSYAEIYTAVEARVAALQEGKSSQIQRDAFIDGSHPCRGDSLIPTYQCDEMEKSANQVKANREKYGTGEEIAAKRRAQSDAFRDQIGKGEIGPPGPWGGCRFPIGAAHLQPGCEHIIPEVPVIEPADAKSGPNAALSLFYQNPTRESARFVLKQRLYNLQYMYEQLGENPTLVEKESGREIMRKHLGMVKFVYRSHGICTDAECPEFMQDLQSETIELNSPTK